MTAAPDDGGARDHGEALRQAIRLSLMDAASSHPWNRGLGLPDATFGAVRRADGARIEAAVVARFEGLEAERRARLVSVASRVDGSTWSVRVEYEDLEQGQRRSLEVASG